MAGNEDVDGDVSGEEAAWRDLVARFDQPVDTEAEQAPWPARENLTETARDRQRPDQDSEAGWDGAGPRTGPGGRPGPASLPASLPVPGVWPDDPDDPGADAPEAGRPADGEPANGATTHDTATDDTATDNAATDNTATHDITADDTATHGNATGHGPNGTSTSDGPQSDRSPGGAGPGGPRPGGRARIIRRAGPGRPDQEVASADDEDEDDRYIPPPPEPLPPLDPVSKGAWAGVILGPGYLLVWRLAGWEIPSWAALVAIVAFVAGFATLIVRMGDGPRDDDDDGAVV